MVAVIHSGASLRAALNYNEKKVSAEQAVCIAAKNYPKQVEHLSVSQKLNFLQNQASLNLRSKVNSVHISLNFDTSEQMDKEKLNEIAASYMDKIGFGQQPFLVYEHKDAGHPHIHLLTTNIRSDGSRIPLHNLGKNQSEKARKEIEMEFNLVKADGRKKQFDQQIKPAMISADYGKVETKKAIANVLAGVVDRYKFTSIPELNAALRRYNVLADRGHEESRTFQKGGLHYRVLDSAGKPVGVPIKASDFAQKPTLKYLQNRFQVNQELRQKDKTRVQNAIDMPIYGQKNITLDRLVRALSKESIDTVIRKNEAGLIYGLTYVDHRTKAVFNGSSLGKKYSAKGIQERILERNPAAENEFSIGIKNQQIMNQLAAKQSDQPSIAVEKMPHQDRSNAESDALFDPVRQGNYAPGRVQSRSRKKKKEISQSL